MISGYNYNNVKIFISYRNREPSIEIAHRLENRLETEYGYDVFIDTEELRGGEHWKNMIYSNVRSSDVLLVLLQPETASSEWVQREVDLARGAGVRILPIDITVVGYYDNAEQVNITEVQDRFALSETQFEKLDAIEANFDRFVATIEHLSKQTRDGQQAWMRAQTQRRRVTKAEDDKSLIAYDVNVPELRPCRVHLATGDMCKLRDIDVLVNSENDFMQMARIYESHTLSSTLRREGSLMESGRLIEDTVQDQLDDQIQRSARRFGRPVVMCQVIPTHAGHPQSTLVAKNKARYIFHTATVRIDAITVRERLTPIDTDAGIELAVRNVLNTITHVDEQRGMISPEGTNMYEVERTLAKNYRPIHSIILPLFGTGEGGRPAVEVARPMVRAIRDFLRENRDSQVLQLEDIHLCVYSESDVPFVRGALDRYFGDSA